MFPQENAGKAEKRQNSKITRSLSVANGSFGVVEEEDKLMESTGEKTERTGFEISQK